jgi:redox-sensing transcriptional repressor
MRLLKYKNALKRMKSFGFIKAYSNNLGDAIGITSVQVRKDFSLFSISGSKKGGYNIDDLLEQINKILGKQVSHKVILVGYGKIGKALVNYRGFKSESIDIVAAFDHNADKINREAQTPVLPIEEIKDYIIDNKIEIAILTVPDLEAQRMFDVICNAGIIGVLNFAPIKPSERPNCIIHDVNIAAEIEALFYFTNDLKKADDK